MGCGASYVAGAPKVGDPVELRRGAASEVLRPGEVGEVVELSVAGAAKVNGPMSRTKWVLQSDLRVAAPPGLGPVQQATWWWHRMNAAPRKWAALGATAPSGVPPQGTADEPTTTAPGVRTHWDMLSPHVPTVAMYHLAARSQSLAGGWAGNSTGAAVVADICGLGEFTQDTMSQFGDAGAVKLGTLINAIFSRLVECARKYGGCIHLFGARFLLTFCSPPTPPISPSPGQSLDAVEKVVLRLTVTVIRCTDLKKADLFGKSDPYVSVSGDNIVATRTSTVENGGSSPAWGCKMGTEEVAGERLHIRLPASTGQLCIRCFDADLTGLDELLGQVWIALPAPQQLVGSEMEGWHELTTSDRLPAGRIYLRLSCQGPRDEADDQAAKACRCACMMRREVAKLGGAVGLRMEAGIGKGSMQLMHLCRDDAECRLGRRAMVVRGTAVHEALRARAFANNTNTLTVSPAIVECCQDDIPNITQRPGVAGGCIGIETVIDDSGIFPEVAIAAPSHFGITTARSKAHQGLLPYTSPLAVAFANHPSEFRRCTCVAVKLHGYPACETGLRSVADLNACFGDAVVHLEQGDGMILATGFATDICTIMAVFGLGDNEQDAAHCELHAVMGALKLVAALKQKMNGSELPAHNGLRIPVTASRGGGSAALFENRVGCSVGISCGWVLVGRCGHEARHNVCAIGVVPETAQRLMADSAANGSILITDAVQKKIVDDVETTTLPSTQISSSDYFKEITVHRACQLRSYL